MMTEVNSARYAAAAFGRDRTGLPDHARLLILSARAACARLSMSVRASGRSVGGEQGEGFPPTLVGVFFGSLHTFKWTSIHNNTFSHITTTTTIIIPATTYTDRCARDFSRRKVPGRRKAATAATERANRGGGPWGGE